MESPVVFINIGWMKKYAGPSANDLLKANNFGYFKHYKTKEAVGHEQWNFLGTGGLVYGYVPRSASINISRLGAPASAERLDGVLAVFMARDPAEHQLKVVGWYNNATVSRSTEFGRSFAGTKIEASVICKEGDAYLLPVAQRHIVVPTAKRKHGGVGQSPIWYAEKHPDVVRKVRALVNDPSSTRSAKATSRPPRNNDPESRQAVEQFAMDWALRYFEEAEDVSRQCKGWDVEAASGKETIYIEVKGITGPAVSFELTPNEYQKMKEYRHRYYLFVVTEARTKKARARTFRCASKDGNDVWVSDSGEMLRLTERIGAWIKV